MSWRRTLKSLLNLTNSALRLSISSLTSACRFSVNRRLSLVTKSMKAGNGSGRGYLNKFDKRTFGEKTRFTLLVGLDTDPEAGGAGDGS
jgi:hypothetical protein